jgi:hypothetical protein
MKRFEVFHQTSLRRILVIRWFFHVSNGEVLKRAGIKSIETFVSSARLCWYGHVVRMPHTRLPKFEAQLREEVGRLRGRPRKNWKVSVLEDAANFAGFDRIDNDTVQALASDRVDGDA